MSEVIWRWADASGQQRRVRTDELRAALTAGVIAPNTPVWRPGWKAWQPAHEVPELMTSALAAANGVVQNIPPPPLAMVAVQHEYEAKSVPPPPVRDDSESPPPPPAFVPMPVRPQSIPPQGGPSSPRPPSVAPAPAAAAPQRSSPPASVPRASVPPALPARASSPPPAQAVARAASLNKPTIPFGSNLPAPSPPNPQSEEELSGSVLLDSESTGPDAALPPPTEPVQHPMQDSSDASVSRIGGPGMRTLFGDVMALSPKNKFVLPVFATVAAMLALAVLGGFVGVLRMVFRSEASTVPTSPSASSVQGPTSVPSGRALVPTAAPLAVPSASLVRVAGACAVTDRPHVLVPRAAAGAGIEVRASDTSFFVGFATVPTEGLALRLDPTLRIAKATARERTRESLKQVVAAESEGNLVALVSSGDKGRARRYTSDGAFELGVEGANLTALALGRGAPVPVFALADRDTPIDALRAAPLDGGHGYALVMRQGSNVLFGRARGDAVLVADGALRSVAGKGGGVGAPQIAESDGSTVIVFADRPRPEDPYVLQWVNASTPEAPSLKVVEAAAVPAQSPSVAAIGKGLFLLAWTEGPAKSHQVRAMVMDAAGTPRGAPFAVSLPGQNAGQAQIAMQPGGQGLVAYFVESAGRYEVAVVKVQCGP